MSWQRADLASIEAEIDSELAKFGPDVEADALAERVARRLRIDVALCLPIAQERLSSAEAKVGETSAFSVAPGKLPLHWGRERPLATGPTVPGKRSITETLSVVQRLAERGPNPKKKREDDDAVAAQGAAGGGEQVPFLSELSASFGKHDISSVRAHRGEVATAAARALGARAYASGEDIVFGVSPDLRTAAHESAHVVQQRAGVSVDGGFGKDGDRYEQHADRVADAVVRGESAEPILDEMSGGSAGSGGAAVQLDPNRDGEGGDTGDGAGGENAERDGRIESYPAADHLPDSTPVYRFARDPAGAIREGNSWWQTQPNTAHGGPLGNRHLLQTTLGELRAQGQVRLDPAEFSQGGDLGTSLIVFHDDGVTHVPGAEVDSGIIGWGARGQPIYRPGHPSYLAPEGSWEDNNGQRHFPDEEPDGPPFPPWAEGERPTAPLASEARADSDAQVADDERHRELARRYRSPDRPPETTGDTEIHPDDRHRELARRYRSPDEFHRLVEAGDYDGAVRLLEEYHGQLALPAGTESATDREFHRLVEASDYAGAVDLIVRSNTETRLVGSAPEPIRPPTNYDPRVVNDPVLIEGARRGVFHADDPDPTVRSINAGEVRHEDSGQRRFMAPTGTNVEAEYSPTASQGDIGPGGQVSVNHRRVDYDERGNPLGTSGRGVGVQATQHGGELEVTREGRDGRQRSLAVTYNDQRNADGEVIGRDVGVAATGAGSGRRPPITGSITGGYTFDVQSAQEQADGSYTVSWTVGLRGGGGGSANVGRRQGGLSGQGNRSRSGTEVFSGGTREENLRRAESYRTDFESNAVREFDRMLAQELGTVDWWIAQPEGTQRNVQTGGSISGSAGAAILGMLSIGANGTVRSSGRAQVTRGGGNTVLVIQEWTDGHDESLTGGSLVGLEGGLTHNEIVRETFAVDMESGRATLTRLLDRDGYVEAGQAGATLRNRTTEESDGTTAGVNVMILGAIGGGESTGERVEQVIGPNGEVTERVTQLGEENFTGNTVFGDYARGGLRVEAPEGDGDYQILQQSHATDDQESASMLARASGDGRAGQRARSSGNWTLSETLSQEDARRFHENLLERYGEEGPPLGDPVRGVWGELQSVGLDDRAGRARVICAFLADQGRTGLRALRSLSGTRGSSRYVRLYTGDGEDLMDGPNGERIHTFLGQHRAREIERWIADHSEGAIDPADVLWAEGHAAQLTARIERIADVDNFTDMPPEMRQDILGRYRNYRSQLQSVIRRAGSDVASEMGEEGQEHHAELEALREQVERAQHRAARAREQVRRFRQEWGQESSERRRIDESPGATGPPLPEWVQQRTPAGPGYQRAQQRRAFDGRFQAMWSEAEGQFQGAEDAREAAEARLNASLRDESEHGEHRQRAAYRSAGPDLERARIWYGEAREQMVHLANSYRRFERAADAGDLDAEAAEGAGAQSSSQADPTSPSTEHEPTNTEHEPTNAQPERAEPEASEPDSEQTMRFVLPSRRLGRDITANGMPNMEPYTLPNGLVVEALGPGACQRYSNEFEAQHADGHEAWAIRMRVVTPATGYGRLETAAYGWDGHATSFVIENAAGETFAQTAITPRPSIAS